MKKKYLSSLLHDCLTVIYAFAAMGILAALALNMSFLNPVAQMMKSFSVTDIFYHVISENAEPDTSRIITIVDMTEITDRKRLADVLEEIQSMQPKAVGVDIVFEGWKPDTVGDMRIMDVAAESKNTVFAYRLLDYENDSVGYAQERHSFFTDIVPVKEGFTNYERTLYNVLKRHSNLQLTCKGQQRTSMINEVAKIYTTESDASDTIPSDVKKLDVNFRPTVFPVVPADSLRAYSSLIKDHVVLYGAVNELSDTHYTPIGVIPGVELLAYSLQTIFEQNEVKYLSTTMTVIVSFFIVLLTYLLKNAYMSWATRQKSEWVQFLMTSTFVVGMLLFIWSSILVGISFVLFYKTNLCVNLGWALAAIPFLGGAKEFFGLTMQRLSGNIRLFMIIVLFGAFSINTNAQKYSVVSITGKVMVENTNTKKQRELQLREHLSDNTVLYLPFKGQVELFCEQTGKKHILKAPGKGNLQKMLSNKENTVIQLTKHYLAYIKARMKSDGELSARHYSDPATVTREIAVKQPSQYEEYAEFRRQANAKYEKFRQNAIKEYAQFMRQAWRQMDAKPKRIPPVEKDVPPVVVDDDSSQTPVESRPIKVSDAPVVLPVVLQQPKPKNPIVEQPTDTTEYVEFQIYGTPMKVRFSDKELFALPQQLTSDNIAEVYEKLANANFNNTIHDCLELRQMYQLCDWAYLKMLSTLSETCFPTHNEATLFMAYLAQQTGYQIRLAHSDNKLYMLYANSHTIYRQDYYTIDMQDYYVYGHQISNLNICSAEYPNEKPASLDITQTMLLAEKMSEQRTLTSKRYPDFEINVAINENLLDFYANYPSSRKGYNLMTRWAIYACKPMDVTVQRELYTQLKNKLSSLSQKEAVERLLNWMQTAFTYEYDEKVWGDDRAFFPEETLYYPYCDCEDRSILLARLVRDILGLKSLLIYYPGHLAMAVGFTEDVKGDYIEYEGKKYVVCDPTFIGASVGRTMTGMDNESANVIVIDR
jgi:CHASE2 domain-containing sensor protein